MVGGLLACVGMFVRVRSRCNGQTLRDPVQGFNGLYRGGVIPVPAFACGNKERCSRGVVGTRRRQAEMVRPEGLTDGMLKPASLKTQRRQDQTKEGSAPLCVFASLREPIRVFRALRGPKNLRSLNHESHRTHESFHERCHQREPWQPQETRQDARTVRRTWSGRPSRLRVRFLSIPASASREVAKAAKSGWDGAFSSLRVYQRPFAHPREDQARAASSPDDWLHVPCLWGRLR
jgi:hypothetical protein